MSGSDRLKVGVRDLQANHLDQVHPAQRAKISTKGANRMEDATWPSVKGNLASTRQSAATFLENLRNVHEAMARQNWVAKWTKIGDAHQRAGELKKKTGAFDEATKAWLCALTSFEVARRLVDEDDPENGDLSAKIEAGIRAFGSSLARRPQPVQIECWDRAGFPAHYVPGPTGSRAPAVICISREEEAGVTLLGRLLPVVINRDISVLVVSHADVSNHPHVKSEMSLSCCLDYLSVRHDVDDTRIGVYGEGLSAVLATDFALSDRRITAAVCDGGLWNWARTLASVGWLTTTANVIDEDAASVRRLRLARQLKCPVLLVAGGRGIVNIPEATTLHADCVAARIDLELVVSRMVRSSLGEIENFVASDDHIFGWLEDKLAHGLAP
ncbi:alpha/beta hydrolase family protein [Bradyrhizobium sp. USDA 4506]